MALVAIGIIAVVALIVAVVALAAVIRVEGVAWTASSTAAGAEIEATKAQNSAIAAQRAADLAHSRITAYGAPPLTDKI